MQVTTNQVTKNRGVKKMTARMLVLLSLLPGLTLGVGAALLAAAPVSGVAAEGDGEQKKRPQRKTRRTPSLSEKIYKKLTKAQELIEEKKYDAGLAALHAIEEQPKLTPYEKAQLYNYFAYTYFTMERFRDAISSYEKVLQQPDLPEALEQSSYYTLAQLYFILEEYQKAMEILQHWFSIIPKPTESAYILLGQGYYQMEDYQKSLEVLQKAYKMVKDRDGRPKENLLLLLRVVYFTLDDFDSMVKILRELVSLYPKPDYWLTLAGAYSELKQYDKQLSIMEMLYEQEKLTRSAQLLNLANLYLLHEAPYKAALLIDKGMKEEDEDKKIKRDVRNLRLLSQAWLQAQESKRSIPPLKEAARRSKDGELDMRLAQAYLNLDRYKEAAAALNQAIKKGGLKDKAQAYILKGLAEFELQRYEAAIDSFQVAAIDKKKKNRKSAQNWLDYVNTEVRRKQQLEEAFASLNERISRARQ